MLPSAEGLLLRRVRRNLFGALPEQDLEGNRNPKDGAAEAEERVAAGRMKGPEAVTEQTAGYEPADTHRAKVFISISAAEFHRHRNCFRACNDFVRRALSAASIEGWKALGRLINDAQGQLGWSNRIGSLDGH
jgi:hypothetical protein